MTNTILRKWDCPTGSSCPTVKRVDGGHELVGYRRDDPELPDNEAKIFWPDSAQMLPELAQLHIPDLDAYLKEHRRTPGDLLRVQTLAHYGVPSDDEDYLRYINGESVPLSPYREPWYQQLRKERAAGQIWRNVHIVNLPLSDYLRYAFEWGYSYNVEAGQAVRILDTTAHSEVRPLIPAGDFYVIDGREIVLMRYAEDGTFLGAVGAGASSTQGYIALAEVAWAIATPFTEWWAEHPQYHRNAHAA